MTITLTLDGATFADVQAEAAQVAGATVAPAIGAPTGTTTTPAPAPTQTPTVDPYFPANPGNALFPSPLLSTTRVVNAAITGKPYVLDKTGAIWEFSTDASGNPIKTTQIDPFTVSTDATKVAYQFAVNGLVSTWGAVQIMLDASGVIWIHDGNGYWRSCETADNPNVGTRTGSPNTTLPVAGTSATGGTITVAPVPAPPTPSAVAPGSTGKTVLFGANQTYKTLAAAISAANPGDTVKAGPELAGMKVEESVPISKPLVLDGGGTLVGAGTASPTWTPGAILDATGIPDPNGYAHQLGGLVPMADVVVQGWEIVGFGMLESSGGGTAGIRPGADCNVTVRGNNIHDNQNGLFSGGFNTAWDVEGNWIHNNSLGDGSTHDIYLSGGTHSLKLKGNTITMDPAAPGKAGNGHPVKCRAPYFDSEGNYFSSADSTDIDLPNGTARPYTSKNDYFYKPAGASNHGVIGYAMEKQDNGLAGGTVSGGTMDLQCDKPLYQATGGVTVFDNTIVWKGNKLTEETAGTTKGLPA